MGIDFKLPKRSFLDDTDIPRTYAPWLDGFRGNVRFEQWTDFDELVSNLADQLDLLNVDDFKESENYLGVIRDFINWSGAEYRPSSIHGFVCSRVPSIIFHVIAPFVNHLENIDTCELMEKTFYFENAKELWRTMCLPANTEEGIQNARPLPKERVSDYTLMVPTPSSNGARVPICAFDFRLFSDILAEKVWLSNPSGQSTDIVEESEVERGLSSSVSAKELCTRYNTLFTSDVNDSEPPRNAHERSARSTAAELIAQTLMHSLSVASGCAFLSNYEFGVAFEVVKRDVDGQIYVQTSRSFRCDEKAGAIIAMIAFSLHSIKRVKEDKGMPEYIQCLARQVLKVTRDVQDAAEHDESENNRTGNDPNQATLCATSANQVAHNNTKIVNAWMVCPTSQSNSNSTRGVMPDGKDGILEQVNKIKDDSLAETRECKGTIAANCGMGNMNKDAVSSEASDAKIMGIREARHLERYDIIGQGHSGIVFEALWNGKRVAIKEWNGLNEDGLQFLEHEVSIILSMKKECPSLLGRIVPNVVLAWKASGKDHYGANEPILVTEFVGEGLCRDEDGRLLLGDTGSHRLVNRTEERAICNAAAEALKTLHTNGFAHGSVHLRNLRVKKETESTSTECPWRVWWIDFGRAIRTSQTRYTYDIGEDCTYLFRTEV